MAQLSAERLARILAAFANEHGVPNGISPGEIADGRDVTPMAIGRVIRRQRDTVNRHLRPRGYEVTDYSYYGQSYGWRIEIDSAPATSAYR